MLKLAEMARLGRPVRQDDVEDRGDCAIHGVHQSTVRSEARRNSADVTEAAEFLRDGLVGLAAKRRRSN